MVKNEYVKLFQGKLKENGLDLTQAEINTVIESLGETLSDVFEQGESLTLGGYLKFEQKVRKERSGTTSLPGKEPVEWVSPECVVPVAKLTNKFVDSLKKVQE